MALDETIADFEEFMSIADAKIIAFEVTQKDKGPVSIDVMTDPDGFTSLAYLLSPEGKKRLQHSTGLPPHPIVQRAIELYDHHVEDGTFMKLYKVMNDSYRLGVWVLKELYEKHESTSS